MQIDVCSQVHRSGQADVQKLRRIKSQPLLQIQLLDIQFKIVSASNRLFEIQIEVEGSVVVGQRHKIHGVRQAKKAA